MKDSAPERLRNWGGEIGIVLGSGLNSLVDQLADAERIRYSEFPELPQSRIAGHEGQFAFSRIGDTRVIYAQGRSHLYEGHSAQAITAGVRLLAASGVSRFILTNAAGTLNPDFHPGSWMMISDHINLSGASPLVAAPQFIDMRDAYSPAWRAAFRDAAAALGVILHEGIYASVLGPQYETPAEVRMLRTFGVDAVGMSTISEAIQARALGLEVIGFSCLTNWAAGESNEILNHDDVLQAGRKSAADFERLLARALTTR
ncbi:MAG: purine-nucleoside phosphorylase [Chthoniobacterales bacterium]